MLEIEAVERQGRAELEKFALAAWASRRRQELLELLDRLNPTIEELNPAVEQEARKRPEVLRLVPAMSARRTRGDRFPNRLDIHESSASIECRQHLGRWNAHAHFRHSFRA